jgi:cyclopropane fatty-acyl-phospholipid synthase-like methyltransferase
MKAKTFMSFDKIRDRVQQYYDEKIHVHGATARGVDWNSAESQQMRFGQLLKLVDRNHPFTINDFGCGYGALVDYLVAGGFPFRYCGFDISVPMIAKAEESHRSTKQTAFVSHEAELSQVDYTVASGVFNVKFDTPTGEWEKYFLNTLEKINSLSSIGFAFNVLTKYSDPEFMRPDLYYADPLFFFDYCKRKFSRFVALLHDYPLYEFTILVRKDS